jgi:hypothetical protein
MEKKTSRLRVEGLHGVKAFGGFPGSGIIGLGLELGIGSGNALTYSIIRV